MKIKDGFMLRRVGGEYIVAAVGEQSRNFNGIIRLNDTGAFLWERLSQGSDEDSLAAAMLESYDINEQDARRDIRAFEDKLRGANLVE